jgi:hypothetical protein
MIAQVDKGYGVTVVAQFEPEETATERQCLINIPHLQCDVVEAHDARFQSLLTTISRLAQRESVPFTQERS